MAALAMGKLPPSLAPLFSAPNDNKVSKPMCLMAKDSKVNPPPKNTISCKPSLLDCVEDAGKYNPSYVLMKSKDGYVYAKYVGITYGDDYHYAIWVPKTLVTNKRGPIPKWVPTTKT